MEKIKLGDSERELLVYIARNPDCTVRSVSDHFAAERGWGRTTVLKTMDRLMEKGHLTRKEVEGVFRYRSAFTETELQDRLIEQFLAGSLGGSISPLVAFLDGQSRVSPEELAELKALVKRLEERRS